MRYADDCNIFVRSLRAGQRVMASIRPFLESRLLIQVNEEKSKVARPEEIQFLGFRFPNQALRWLYLSTVGSDQCCTAGELV